MNIFVPVTLYFDQIIENDKERLTVKLVRINLRNKLNIFDLPDLKFLKNFRISKDTFLSILHILDLPTGIRSTHITPDLQLAVTLNFLGSGGYQRQVGADWSAPMGQSTICEVTTSTLRQMERKLCPLKIKFMPSALERTKTHFYEKFGFPGVIGCIDGTHIMILRPTENEHIFFNRKGRHSINAMIICDHEMKILAINAKYGGSAHDSFVWKQSLQRDKLNANYCSGTASSWLLGDSGYPLEPFLLTPYRNATLNSPESIFNKKHAQARSIVERCIGVMKCRWRSILEERKLRYCPKRAAQIINVCAALHNICIENGEPNLDDFLRSPTHETGSLQAARQNDSNEGIRIRNRIRDDLWINRSRGH